MSELVRLIFFRIFVPFVLCIGFSKQSFTINTAPKSQGYHLYRCTARTPDLRELILEMIAIYKITNLITGDCYVGRTIDLNRRMLEHFSPKRSQYPTAEIYQAIAKYGKHNFSIEVLEELNDPSKLDEKEIFWIAKLNPAYNKNKGGRGNFGYKPTEATKNRLKQFGKIQWENKTDEEKQRIIKQNLTGPKGKYVASKETKEKIRLANIGKKQSAETILKRSAKMSTVMIGNKSGNKRIVSKLNGVIVKEYESVKSAALEFSSHPSQITAVLRGRRKKFMGLNWEYAINNKNK